MGDDTPAPARAWSATARTIGYIPITAITQDDLLRGQQKFTIYCAVCHGAVGDGQGMIVKRGMVPFRRRWCGWIDRSPSAK